MDNYKVVVNPKAIRELDDIYNYIAFDKLNPQASKKLVDRIKEGILGLSTFPNAHQERQVGMYGGRGFRQLLVDNYIVIFKVEEETKTVSVVTVQYYGRDF